MTSLLSKSVQPELSKKAMLSARSKSDQTNNRSSEDFLQKEAEMICALEKVPVIAEAWESLVTALLIFFLLFCFQLLTCPIRGSLMQHPIRSPHGYVFDRQSVVERGDSFVCPYTKKLLQLTVSVVVLNN